MESFSTGYEVYTATMRGGGRKRYLAVSEPLSPYQEYCSSVANAILYIPNMYYNYIIVQPFLNIITLELLLNLISSILFLFS